MQFPEGPNLATAGLTIFASFEVARPGHPVWKTFANEKWQNSTVRVIVLIYRACVPGQIGVGIIVPNAIYMVSPSPRGGGGARRRRGGGSKGYVVGSYSIVKVYVY